MDDCIYEIYRNLDEMRINHANSGYRYLARAVEIGLDNPMETMNIKQLYKEVGKTFGKSETGIERAIRYSIIPTGLTNKEFIMQSIDSIYSLHSHTSKDENE